MTIDQWALGQIIDAASRVAVAGERRRLHEWATFELSIRTTNVSYANGQRYLLRRLLAMTEPTEIGERLRGQFGVRVKR